MFSECLTHIRHVCYSVVLHCRMQIMMVAYNVNAIVCRCVRTNTAQLSCVDACKLLSYRIMWPGGILHTHTDTQTVAVNVYWETCLCTYWEAAEQAR